MKHLNFKLSFLFLITFILLAVATSSWAQAINIKLKVVAHDQVLFDNVFAVEACVDSSDGETTSVNAWCAIDQISIDQGWTASSTWYSYGVMLNSLNQYDGLDGNYWLWYADNEPGATALNQHTLTTDENLLLAYGIWPLKVSASTSTPALNSSSTLDVSYFDVDTWSWQAVTDSNFIINGQTIANTGNAYDLLVSTTTPYIIKAQKDGFLESPVITISGVAEPTPEIEESNIQENGVASTGNNYSVALADFKVDEAINFLSSQQNSDGSIGQTIINADWSAIALASYGNSQTKDKLKQYLMSSAYNTALGVGVTDLDRRAMALMALGVSPYDGTKTNYIEKIVATFDGQQIGDSTIFNDDIFSLLVLLRAGFKAPEPVVVKTIEFILKAQGADGSWGSVDLTSASVQVLSLAKTSGNLSADQLTLIDQALLRAKNYLQQTQESDASFNHNVFSTSWAMQAIATWQEPLSAWTKNSQTPLSFLGSHQANDGGLNKDDSLDNRLWATAYAVPASLNKSWGDILTPFTKPIAPVTGEQGVNSSAPTSSLEIISDIATSTTNMASSTPDQGIVVEEVPAEETAVIDLKQPSLIEADRGSIEVQPSLAEIQPAVRPVAKKVVDKQFVEPEAIRPAQVLAEKIEASTIAPTSGLPDETNLNQLGFVKIIFYSACGFSLVLVIYLIWKFVFRKV